MKLPYYVKAPLAIAGIYTLSLIGKCTFHEQCAINMMNDIGAYADTLSLTLDSSEMYHERNIDSAIMYDVRMGEIVDKMIESEAKMENHMKKAFNLNPIDY